MIRKAYKYRIYPNNKQKDYFAKCFGCVRFFYNKSLNDMNDIYKSTQKFEDITPAQYKEDYPFLKEIDSLALANAQLNRNSAFKAYFRGNNELPKLKSKRNDQSYTTNNQKGSVKFSNDDKYIDIPKCKRIRIKKHRDFIGIIKSSTISKTTDEKYYISLLVESDIKPLKDSNKAIGLDLGVKDLVTDSDGNKYQNHKYFALNQEKLAHEQRKLSHMKKGSNNFKKQKIKIAKIHKKITNQRNDYLHKLSKHIVDENQIICVEDLQVMKMTKDNDYNKSMLDASMSKLLTMLIYKANWYHRTLVKVPSNFASSQICHECGYKNSITKNLTVRKWICPKCGANHDRDINAARNILSKGISILTKGGAHPDSLSNLGSLESLSKKPPLL